MKSIIPLGLGMLLITGHALGADTPSPPRYDVVAYCHNVGNAVGGSATVEQTCMSGEQSAYNGLKADWAKYPPRVRSYCDMVARAIGGSYSVMATCVQMEMQATGAPQQFKF